MTIRLKPQEVAIEGGAVLEEEAQPSRPPSWKKPAYCNQGLVSLIVIGIALMMVDTKTLHPYMMGYDSVSSSSFLIRDETRNATIARNNHHQHPQQCAHHDLLLEPQGRIVIATQPRLRTRGEDARPWK